MRLIDADKLLHLPFHYLIHTDYMETGVPIEFIENAEVIEERLQGKWIIVNDVYCKCPFCNDVEVKFSNYCPNCGAKLEV